MKKIKVAVDSGPVNSGHAVRGVGFHTKILFEHLVKVRGLDVRMVDFTKEDLGKFDIAHYQYFHPYFVSVPFRKKTRVLLTVHDLTPLVYPKSYAAGIKGKVRYVINRFLVKKADGIITISETSKKDICRFLGVSPDLVQVVHLAPRDVFKPVKDKKLLEKVRQKYLLPETFVLYVGDVNYNKNIPTLIKACRKANVHLVICGKQAMDIEDLGVDIRAVKGPRDWIRYLFGIPHPELAHFSDLLKEFDENPKILRLGFVPDEDLVAIYNLASVYCQPSFYEGFGLPVLEAMASGTAVVAARNNAHVEIASDAALYADPKDYEEMGRKLKKVISDGELRVKLQEKGLARAGEFSWGRTASQTAKVYKLLLKEKGKGKKTKKTIAS